jgi:hypothetical protein
MTQTLNKLRIEFKLLKVTKDITWQLIFFSEDNNKPNVYARNHF